VRTRFFSAFVSAGIARQEKNLVFVRGDLFGSFCVADKKNEDFTDG
jgi:hypothetical protein